MAQEKNSVADIKWVEEHTGLPPYWRPGNLGDHVMGRLESVDSTDPDHTRFVFVAISPTTCWRGPSQIAEPCTVQPGERFTVSAYHSLVELARRYLIVGIQPLMMLTFKDKVKTASKNTVWAIDAKVDAASKQLLAERRTTAITVTK